MSLPAIGVVIPCYKAERTLRQTVESVLQGAPDNLQLVLVEDGSPDGTGALCDALAAQDPRVTALHQPNGGASAARNAGLDTLCRSGAEWVLFVDADDTIQPYATEMLVARAEESGADLVIAHYNRITPPRPRSEASARPERPTKVQTFGFLLEGAMTKEEFAAGLMQEPASFYYGVMWNKLYRADIVHAHDDIICAEDMDWSEDLYFNLSYIRYAEKFYALSTPIYNYYNTPGSAVHTVLNPVNIVSTRATLFAYYKELYENLGLYEEYKPQIYKYLVAVAES